MKEFLVIVDNLFFDKLKEVELQIKSFIANSKHEQLANIMEKSDIIYVNNDNTTFDSLYTDANISIVNSISEIDFKAYKTVIYFNVPFSSFSKEIERIHQSSEYDTNTLITQAGFNLSFRTDSIADRYILSKAKPGQRCSIGALDAFMFKPSSDFSSIPSQSELIKTLTLNGGFVVVEWYNAFDNNSNTFFDTVQQYFNFCLADVNTAKTFGNYIINFSEDISKDIIYSYIDELIRNNEYINIDLRSVIDVNDLFGTTEVQNANGALELKDNYAGDAYRVSIEHSKETHYDENHINMAIDFNDRHIRPFFIKQLPSHYYKMYNSNYGLLQLINKEIISNATKIAVKRTMGLGDSLLALPIVEAIHRQYGKDVDFYSQYNIKPYLSYDFIKNNVIIDGNYIFKDITDDYDLVIDLDLAYENTQDNDSFFANYLKMFDKALDIDYRKPYLKASDDIDDAKYAIVVGEGSGWKSKEPSMDIIEYMAYSLKKMGYTIIEPGINRITNYADITNPKDIANPKSDFDMMFKLVAKASLYVGTDSGVAHIANLMGKKCFVIGGSVNPSLTLFNQALVSVFGYEELPCYGCRHRFRGYRALSNGQNTFVPNCYNKHQFECMQELTIENLKVKFSHFTSLL